MSFEDNDNYREPVKANPVQEAKKKAIFFVIVVVLMIVAKFALGL
jgi:hypothetical protein